MDHFFDISYYVSDWNSKFRRVSSKVYSLISVIPLLLGRDIFQVLKWGLVGVLNLRLELYMI